MAEVEFAVYPPPRAGLPFLAVEMLTDGSIIATAYESQGEADAHERLATKTVGAGDDERSGLGKLLP